MRQAPGTSRRRENTRREDTICADIEIMQISLGSGQRRTLYKCIIGFWQRIATLRLARPREPRRSDDAFGALTASSAISANCFTQSPVLDFIQAVKDGQ